MASKEHKIVRKAQVLSELSRLSGLLAEQLNIEVPDVRITNRDPELTEIQRIENVNVLLGQVLESRPTEPDEVAKKKPVRSLKHGAK